MSNAKTTNGLTPSQQIRLESIQLAYRHDRNTQDIIKRASDLSEYVEGERAAGKRSVNDRQVLPDDEDPI